MDEEKKNYINKYIERSLKHKNLVCDLMFFIFKNENKLFFKIDKWELLRRAVVHDNDKFTQKYNEDMADYWLYCDNMTQQEKDRVNQSYINHKKLNNHHQMYFEVNNLALNNEDVCEIACDFISSARKNDNDIIENANIWKERFNNSLQNSNFLAPYKEKFYNIFELCEKYFC